MAALTTLAWLRRGDDEEWRATLTMAALTSLAWLRRGDDEEWRAAALGCHGRQVEPHVALLLRLVLRVPAWWVVA